MKFLSIQMFRALAANAVVLSHLHGIEEKYGKGLVVLPDWTGSAGPAGVHFFFVISGFVMIFASEGKSWREFLAARIARIYPAYWLYTSIVVALVCVVPSSISFSLPSARTLVLSYLLWPDTVAPLLSVGWSLVFEMHFYLVLTIIIVLAIPLRWAIPIWFAVITMMMLTVGSIGAFTAVAFSPLTLEFLGGSIVGLLVKNGYVRFGRSFLIAGVASLVVAFLRYGPYAQPGDSALLSVCLLGPPFALIIYGAAVMERFGQWKSSRLWVLLGDASYSTYLSHVIVLSALGRVFQMVTASGLIVEAAFVVACIVIVNAVGMVSYFGFERPSTRISQSLLRVTVRRPVVT